MDTKQIADRIEELDRAIAHAPLQASLYMERGRLHHKAGVFHKALNDFLKVRELTGGNPEADGYIELLQEIFAFRYNDSYNL